MPPKHKFSRDEIIQAALGLVRTGGISSVTARSLATQLGSSSKPIFSLFENMEEVLQELLKAADELYQQYLSHDMSCGKYPVYKASGMAYIRFAQEEKELFKLLFMRDRSSEEAEAQASELDEILAIIQRNTGMSYERAQKFHLEMWIYVHGIATMIATNYIEWQTELVSDMLTDVYEGLKCRYSALKED